MSISKKKSTSAQKPKGRPAVVEIAAPVVLDAIGRIQAVAKKATAVGESLKLVRAKKIDALPIEQSLNGSVASVERWVASAIQGVKKAGEAKQKYFGDSEPE